MKRVAPVVRALVIGPEDVVDAVSYTDTLVGPVGIAPPSAIAEALEYLAL
jgi:hypothetical protein